MRPAALFLILLAMPAQAETAAPAAEGPPRPVVSEIVEIERDAARGFVGAVAARTETNLGFPLLGVVAARRVDVGDVARKGEVLARLNPEDLEADLRAAEAGVAVAAAQLRSAADAQARAKELYARATDSKARLEDADRALAAAEAGRAQAEAALAQARDRLSDATLRAPYDGVVTAVFADPGATLSAGEPILRLAATDRLEVEIDVSERDLARLDPGAPFEIALIAAPEVTFAGTLDRVDPEAGRSTRTRRLHLSLSAPPIGVRLGALVHARLAAGAEAAMSLPLSAESAPAVWVVERPAGTVRRRAVTLGERIGDEVRIESGLAPGEEVVVKGVHSLEDGRRVGRRIGE